MTDQELQALKELCEKATPGPWITSFTPERGGQMCYPDAVITNAFPDDYYRKNGTNVVLSPPARLNEEIKENLRFAAASREAIPKLIAEVDRLNCKLVDTEWIREQGAEIAKENESLRRDREELRSAVENILGLYDVHGRTGKSAAEYLDSYLALLDRVQKSRIQGEKK